MKKVFLQVPEPCHEDWNKMSPAEQGRYCGSCSKEVIDFSLWSDKEILDYLSRSKGNTCGRFLPDQLNRSICEPKPASKKWSWGMLMSLLITFAASCRLRTDATAGNITAIPVEQNDHTNTTPAAMTQDPVGVTKDSVVEERMVHIVGELYLPPIGIVEPPDIVKEPAVLEKDSAVEVICDLDSVVITSTSVGRSLEAIAGGVSIVREEPLATRFSTITDTIKSVFNIPSVKVYPNPASKGSAVNVSINLPGDYQLVLMDIQSGVIQQSSFAIFQKNQVYQLNLPEYIATGMYYVVITERKSKKRFTEKLIIQ